MSKNKKGKLVLRILKSSIDVRDTFNKFLKSHPYGCHFRSGCSNGYWGSFYDGFYGEENYDDDYWDKLYDEYYERSGSFSHYHDESDDFQHYDDVSPSEDDDDALYDVVYGSSSSSRKGKVKNKRGKRGSKSNNTKDKDCNHNGSEDVVFTLDDIDLSSEGSYDDGDIDALIHASKDIYYYRDIHNAIGHKKFKNYVKFYDYMLKNGFDGFVDDEVTSKILRSTVCHICFSKDGKKLIVENSYGSLFWEADGLNDSYSFSDSETEN